LPALALRLVRALPASPAVLLTRTTVLAYLACRPDYRSEIRRNLRLVLGHDRRWFWVRNAWRVGRNLALMARIGTGWADTVVDKTRLEGENWAAAAVERDVHMVMVSFHFGAWEFLPQVFARLGFDTNLVTGTQRDASLDRLLCALRGSSGVRVLQDVRPVLAAASGPGITGFMLDNTSRGRRQRVRGDRFDMSIPGLPFLVAERRQARVFPLFAFFDRGRLRVEVGRPGGPGQALAAFCRLVRARPEEWVFWGKSGALVAAACDPEAA